MQYVHMFYVREHKSHTSDSKHFNSPIFTAVRVRVFVANSMHVHMYVHISSSLSESRIFEHVGLWHCSPSCAQRNPWRGAAIPASRMKRLPGITTMRTLFTCVHEVVVVCLPMAFEYNRKRLGIPVKYDSIS